LKITAGPVLVLSFMMCSCGGGNRPPQTQQEADVRIDQLLKDCDHNLDKKQYEPALADEDAILDLCGKFSLRQDELYSITDRKQFTLQQLGRFDEALKVAFELEGLPEEAGNRKSPWNYLKIADSYLGMHDLENTVQWMGRAVYERGFIKYRVFLQDKYEGLQSDSSYQGMLKHMKDKIGLQHPARDFAVTLLDGSEFTLSSQKGKVVLIDFWDVACVPCIKAMPELKNLFAQYSKGGLEIIGISLDTDRELLRKFLEDNAIPWKTTCSYKGWKDETALLYGVNATPSTWLIDRNGILQYDDLRGEELKHAVEELVQM
jgi:peroxiredoxin